LLTSSYGRSDRGTVRSHNEDSFLDDPVNRLWAVADGMGGHEAGDVASQAIVRHLRGVVRTPKAVDYVDRIDDALAAVNAELIDYAQTHRLQMVGSTAALLADAGAYMLCAWAGDSRVYHLGGDGLRQLTVDHNQAREMVSTGQFSAAELQNNAQAGALVRAVGAEPNLVVEWSAAETAPHDVFLLCSDGVTKEMSDADIAGALAQPVSVQDIAENIVATCLARGARDNITAVVVRVEG
jgi:protein phosphatase